MFTAEQGKLLNKACACAFKSARKKVERSIPDLYAEFLMSNCRIALNYLRHIHQIAIEGYCPIAISLFRTYYEIVCSTMYLAEHKDELDDFLKFGRRMYYEIGEDQRLKGALLNLCVPDHKELRQYFLKKKEQRGGKLLSWHGMTIDDLGKAVGMEKYTDQQVFRSQYSKASKFVHGDSLLTVLAYNPDKYGMMPRPFVQPAEVLRADAMLATCALFIALLATIDVGLQVGFKDELDKLNEVWQRVWKEATGVNIQEVLAANDGEAV